MTALSLTREEGQEKGKGWRKIVENTSVLFRKLKLLTKKPKKQKPSNDFGARFLIPDSFQGHNGLVHVQLYLSGSFLIFYF